MSPSDADSTPDAPTQPPSTPMTWRIYFNRCEDWPQIWSIDCGSLETECNVVGWRLEGGVEASSGRAEAYTAVDRTREPVAWIEVTAGRLTLQAGIAVFSA